MQEPDLRRQLIAIVAGSPASRSSSASSRPASTTTSTRRPRWPARWSPPTACRDELGPVTIGEKAGEVFLGASLQELGSVGPATLELIDREVERIVGEAVAQARRRSCGRNWSAVDETAQRADRARDALRRRARRGARRPSSRRCSTSAHGRAATRRRSELEAAAEGGESGAATAALAALAPSRARRVVRAARARRPEPIWRLEQPPPPAGRAVQGAARRARRPPVLGAQPRAADGRGQRHDPARHLQLERRRAGTSWRPSAAARATRRGSPGPGPTEFWTVSEPSLPRAGAGPGALPLQGRPGGRLLQHAGRRRRPVPADDRRPPATGPTTAGSAGSAPRTPLGERVGAFHLHWDGTDLRDRLRAAGPRGQRHGVPSAASCSRARSSGRVAGEPRRTRSTWPSRSRVPRLIHADRRAAPSPTTRSCRRRCRACPTTAPSCSALDSDGDEPLGGRRRRRLRARRAPDGGAVARPPLAARLVGGAFQELTLTGATFGADRPLRRRRRDARAPTTALGHRRPLRRPPQHQQQGDGRADRGATATTTTTRLPPRGAGRGSAARIAFTGARRLLDGDLGRLALPLHRRRAAARATPIPPSRARSTSAPTRRPSSSSPTRRRPTTRSCSRRRRSSRTDAEPPKRARPSGCRRC